MSGHETGGEHHGAGEHAHSHADGGSDSRRLALVAAINVLGFAGELAGGLLFGSVALLSDAFHMLFDALAYVMAFAAAYVAERYDGDGWSYGLHRLEPFAAFVNGLLLLPMVGFVLWESYQRFLAPVDVATGPTLVVATAGLVVNVGSVVVLHGDEMSLNERGAFYHLLGDAGGSLAVIASTLVVATTGVQVVDPITAALIAVVVTWSAGTVLRGSGAIFLHRTAVDRDVVEPRLLGVDGVDRVDDFHAWQICSQITVATVHLGTSAETMDEVAAITHRVHEELTDCGVDHATVELCRCEGQRAPHHTAHCH